MELCNHLHPPQTSAAKVKQIQRITKLTSSARGADACCACHARTAENDCSNWISQAYRYPQVPWSATVHMGLKRLLITLTNVVFHLYIRDRMKMKLYNRLHPLQTNHRVVFFFVAYICRCRCQLCDLCCNPLVITAYGKRPDFIMCAVSRLLRLFEAGEPSIMSWTHLGCEHRYISPVGTQIIHWNHH